MWTNYIFFLLGRANKFTDAKYTGFNFLFVIRNDCLENFVLITFTIFYSLIFRYSFKFRSRNNLQLSNGKCTIEYKNHEYTFTRRSFSHHLSIFDRIFILNVFFCHTRFLQSCDNLPRCMTSSVTESKYHQAGYWIYTLITMKQITLYLAFYNYTYLWNFIPREELKIQRFVPSENDS